MLGPSEIVFLGLNYPPEQTGISPYTGAAAAALVERGRSVRALVGHPHYPEWRIRGGYGQWARREVVAGVEVVRLRHYVPRPPRGVRRLLSELSFGARLLLARWGRPEVVIAVTPALFATWLASLRRGRRPFIVWVQDLYTLGLSETGESDGIAARIARRIESRTLRSADRVVVIHERFAEWIVQELGVSRERVTVIRNWSHLPVAAPVDRESARAALGWSAEDTIVLHAGNQGAKQGLENVVEAARLAAASSAPVRFVLLGDGGERARLQAIAEGMPRLTFIDPLPDSEFRAALAAADVLLVNEKPGVAEMAVPSKLTSYFDAGRPVIAATSVDGITAAELAAADGGVVVAAGDPAALLAGVLALRADPVRAEELGMNGRRFRETVLDEGMAIGRWSELIAELGPLGSR